MGFPRPGFEAVIPNPKLKLMDQPRKLSGPGPRGDAAAPLFNPHRTLLLRLDQAVRQITVLHPRPAHRRQRHEKPVGLPLAPARFLLFQPIRICFGFRISGSTGLRPLVVNSSFWLRLPARRHIPVQSVQMNHSRNDLLCKRSRRLPFHDFAHMILPSLVIFGSLGSCAAIPGFGCGSAAPGLCGCPLSAEDLSLRFRLCVLRFLPEPRQCHPFDALLDSDNIAHAEKIFC